jgi:hypothetical protein
MKKSVRVQFYIDADYLRRIEQEAFNDRRTVSNWVALKIEEIVNGSRDVRRSDDQFRVKGIADATRKAVRNYTG